MFTVTCDIEGESASGSAFEVTTWITGHNAEHLALLKMETDDGHI